MIEVEANTQRWSGLPALCEPDVPLYLLWEHTMACANAIEASEQDTDEEVPENGEEDDEDLDVDFDDEEDEDELDDEGEDDDDDHEWEVVDDDGDEESENEPQDNEE